MEFLAQEQPEPFAPQLGTNSILPFQHRIHWLLDDGHPLPISKREVQMERLNEAGRNQIRPTYPNPIASILDLPEAVEWLLRQSRTSHQPHLRVGEAQPGAVLLREDFAHAYATLPR